MLGPIRNKQDLVRVLGQNQVTFADEIELVNDTDLKRSYEKLKAILRQNKKAHLIILQRT
jgi:hypothetical protein